MVKIIADSWEVIPGGAPRALTSVQAKIPEWADGKVREIVQGEDFSCSVTSMRGTIGSWASRNGYRFQSTIKYIPFGHLRFSLTKIDG